MGVLGRRVVVIGFLVAVTAGGVGFAAGLVFAPVPVPDVVAVSDQPITVDVVPMSFDDTRMMVVEPVVSAEQGYLADVSGVVVESACRVGSAVESGDAVWTVGDQRVVALALERPLWRDLGSGSRGEDVRALQKELSRVGYPVGDDGVFSRTTAAQVKKFWADRGVKNSSVVPLAQVVWLRARSVVPAVCDAKVGDRLVAGQVLFTAGGQLGSLTLQTPAGVTPGERVAVLGSGEQAPIGEDQTVTDSAFLEAFSSSRDFDAWRRDESVRLSVVTRLGEPLRVVQVPASAVYAVEGGSGCVLDAGAPRRVRVVASELGKAMVSSDPLPSNVTAPVPVGASPCE
jgi:peptidoglycan hydrolase-like protein with peptidoglycan-binding domain